MKHYNVNLFGLSVFFCLLSGWAFSQENDAAFIESVPSDLRDSAYYELFKKYRKTDSLKAKSYAHQANRLSLRSGHKFLHAKSWLALCYLAAQERAIDSALYFGRHGIAFSKANGFRDRLIYFYNDMGNLFERIDLYDSSLAYYELSYQEALALNEPYDMAIARNNIGLLHYHLSNFNEAYQNLFDALRIKKDNKIDNGIELNYLNLAIVQNDQGLFNQALANLKLVEERCKTISCSMNTLVNFNFGIGYSYYKTDRKDIAIGYFIKAYDLARQAGDEQAICGILYYFAEIAVVNGDYNDALVKLGEAELLARSNKFRRQLRDIYKLYSRIYDQTGRPNDALAYKDRFIAMKDSIFNETLSNNLKNIQLDVQRKQADMIIAQKDDEISRSQTITLLSTLLAVVMLLLAFFVWRSLKLSNNMKQRLTEEVEARTSELKRSNIEIQRSYAEYDRLVYHISHDLQGPVATIRGLVGVAKMESKVAGIKMEALMTHMERIGHSADGLFNKLSMLTIVNDLRNSKMEPHLIDLDALLQRIVEKFKNVPCYPLVQFQVRKGPFHKGLITDELVLGLILENLLSNAYNYVNLSRGDGQRPYIAIGWEQDEQFTTLSVEDNGYGIPEEARHKLFHIFSVASAHHGSGLGLFLSQLAAARLGGKIVLVRNMNPTTFKLTIHSDLNQSVGRIIENPFYVDTSLASRSTGQVSRSQRAPS